MDTFLINNNLSMFCEINNLIVDEQPCLQICSTRQSFGFDYMQNYKTNRFFKQFRNWRNLFDNSKFELSFEGLKAFVATYQDLLKSISFYSNFDTYDLEQLIIA